jgi:hypothetical protein
LSITSQHGATTDGDLYGEFRRWRLGVNDSWEAFLEWRELKAKADAYDQYLIPLPDEAFEDGPDEAPNLKRIALDRNTGSSGATETPIGPRQASHRWSE